MGLSAKRGISLNNTHVRVCTTGADSATVEGHSSSMGGGERGRGARGARGSDVSSAGESTGSV